jgi:oxygen-independent coproporphyrinogen-3 oxidase
MYTTALYVHIPFCETKCTYCAFNSYPGLAHLHRPYVDALHAEMARAGRKQGPVRAPSLYLGGGTPTALSAGLLRQILEACEEHLGLSGEAEITAEANPGTLDAVYLSSLREMGINRLSLGVQTLDDQLLRVLGRMHSAAEAIETYRLARQAGLANVNLDLIYGLPGQDLPGWTADLSTVTNLRPDHLSLYCLSLHEGTPLADLIDEGELPSPDPDLAAEMYEHAEEVLARAGYVQYEISNWALPGRECRHNMTYWQNYPYLGFGAGAHSFADGSRYYNVYSPDEYVRRMTRGESPVAAIERIDRAAEIGETMIMGLRLCRGVSFQDFERRFGVSLAQVYGAQIREMIDLGLLEKDDRAIRLTARGRLLGNEVFERFLSPGEG